jgi:H+/gluconate symporter-like permease
MSKTALKYGLIGGAILVIGFLIPYFIWGEPTDYTMGEIIGYTGMILSMITVFFAIKSYRDKFSGGKISFLKAFGVGAYVSIIAGIIFGIYSFILYAYVMPEFIDKYYSYGIDQIKKSDVPQEEKERKLKEIEEYPAWMKSPVFNGFLMCITVFAIGLFITLISAAILKRGSPPANEDKQTILIN